MSLLEINQLTFRYETMDQDLLEQISFSMEEGEFVALCGPSGSGKSTLLRHLKTALVPAGISSGSVIFEGRPIGELNEKESASAIGYVMQQPDSQIVTDKVWHELAFGLENMGYDQQTIQRRVAETASYFGIQNWFDRETDTLSGGQKQLLNLASVMVMRPKLLVLDEPVSRLDPIAARDFIETIGRLNREMGMAVLIAEHNLEDVFSLSDRVIVLDHGKKYFEGTPGEVGEHLAKQKHPMALSMPAPMRIYAGCRREQGDYDHDEASGGILDKAQENDICPVSVREGHDWLDEYAKTHSLRSLPAEKGVSFEQSRIRLEVKNIWYRYPQEEKDVIRGASVKLRCGEWLAVLGGNGSGKSTLLKLLSGQAVPWRGAVKKEKKARIALLMQEPKTMFRGFTVREELEGAKSEEMWQDVVKRCRLADLLDRHPYDLSGGEAQRAAMAKLLLTEPDILLMDEPTKGLDAENKRAFAEIVEGLCEKGTAVLMVSHDLEFCAEHAHLCCMLFDGKLQNEGSPRAFCADNHFYTTSAHRMASHLISEAVTAQDVIYACGGEEISIDPPSGGEEIISQGKVTKSGRFRSLPVSSKRIQRNLFFWGLPILILLTVVIWQTFFKDMNALTVSLTVIFEVLLSFFLSFEQKRPGAKEIALIAILCAIGIAGRSAFFMLPQFKPVAALVILSGAAYGPQTGFLVGAGTMLASNLFFGQGPWTPWQMFAMGSIGFFSGFIFRRSACKLSLCVWGGFSVLTIYGVVMNLSTALTYQPVLNGKIILSYLISGLPFDLIHAGATVLFLWILSEEFLKKMDRVRVKFNLEL